MLANMNHNIGLVKILMKIFNLAVKNVQLNLMIKMWKHVVQRFIIILLDVNLVILYHKLMYALEIIVVASLDSIQQVNKSIIIVNI